MIKTSDFYEKLIGKGVDFFTGVPDSLLKDICAYITANTPAHKNIITANEGGAIALATGYHLASNKIPMVYMQNSGIGNAVNPLLSLADKEVYSIPMLLLIGWRGEPGVNDEPQHIKQGRVTTDMLNCMEIPWQLIDHNTDFCSVIETSVRTAIETSAPVAILVRKGTFEPFNPEQDNATAYMPTREEALGAVLKYIPKNAVIVSTTGMLSRELFELREKNNQSHETDFLTVGSMGHASQIALGIALAKTEKQVYCFDGDGSAIMHLGNYAIAGSLAPRNLKIILFNNGAHDSVGGQPTIGNKINFLDAAKSFGLKSIGTVQTTNDIEQTLPALVKSNETAFLEIKIKKGARKDLGRPTSTPKQNKDLLKTFIQK